jgi:hypothetical protein
MKKLSLLLLFSIAMSSLVMAQELNVTVTINTPKLQTADPKIFESLKTAIEEFFNNTKWTDDVYTLQERIPVSLTMTITKEISITDFGAEIILQASRPVYGSEYQCLMLNHVDKEVSFSYEQFQPIQYTQNSFTDNLTSLLSFYAHIILGLDYDSFAPFGGEKYLQTAQEIMNNIPPAVSAKNPGWRSVEGNRNRYWMIENLLTPRVRPMRQAWYNYHRTGLDKMSEDPALGRALMLQSIEDIAAVDKNYPNSMVIQMFSNTKVQEIIDVFAAGPIAEKTKVADLMTRIDPPNANRYRILRG